MTPEHPSTPIFETWTRQNLERFATEAYLKLQDQRALIEQLRKLIASTPENHNGKPS